MNNLSQESNQYYTFEEYLNLLEGTDQKYEYHNGYLIEMAGGTGNHSILCNNVGTELSLGIRQSKAKCVTFNSDMNVWIPKCKKGLFPDVSVVCGQPKYTTERQTVLENPTLIIEVLSESTKNKDKGEKFECYRSLPSFKEYVLVYQSIPRIETWYKEAEDLWRISSAFGLDKSIYIHTLDSNLALSDVYTNVENLNLNDDVLIQQMY